jgi:hypothetical protein
MPDEPNAKAIADKKLQDDRIAFERDKVAYEQNAQHLRSLNQFLWQVPTIAITLTGGLWYGVTKIDAFIVREGLLSFAALSDVLLVIVLLRVRFLFGQYLAAQRGFNPRFEIKSEAGPWILPGWTVVTCFVALLLAGAAGSLYGAWHLKDIDTPESTKSHQCLAV